MNEFAGYPAPTSNFTPTPNQFFDVVLPHASRGVARLVGYMLRRVLGWCDANGNPRETTVAVSYQELERHAGIGHSSIREAIQDALRQRFLRCLREGRPGSEGDPGIPALYELCWDESGAYVTDPEQFRGFFAGEGNYSQVPDPFFDVTVKTETLAVVRVVGAIIRHTIGWQNGYGFRRQQVQLSVTQLERVTGLSREAARLALVTAREHGHLVRVTAGHFDKAAGQTSQAAVYGIHWQDQPVKAGHSEKLHGEGTPKTGEGALRNLARGHSEKLHGEHSEILHGGHSEKLHGMIKTGSKSMETTTERQPAVPPPLAKTVVAPEDKDLEPLRSWLHQQGIHPTRAQQLLQEQREGVENWRRWLPYEDRSRVRNKAGWLIRAIEEEYPAPEGWEEEEQRRERLRRCAARVLAPPATSAAEPALRGAGAATAPADGTADPFADWLESQAPERVAAWLLPALSGEAELTRRHLLKVPRRALEVPEVREQLLALTGWAAPPPPAATDEKGNGS